MIAYDISKYPLVIIHFKPSAWTRQDFDNFMFTFAGLLRSAVGKMERVTVLVKGDNDIKNPPMTFWAWVIGDIVKHRGLFKRALNKTAVFTPSNSLDLFFKMLFAVYTPARPFKTFTDINSAISWIYNG